MSPFVYSTQTGRYHNTRTGRFVSWDVVRPALFKELERHRDEARGWGRQVREGTLRLSQYDVLMRDRIKTVHLIAAEIASGGRHHMSQAEYGRVGGRVASEYRFLRGLMQDLARGRRQALERRSGAYMEAGYLTFVQTRTEEARRRGYDEVRNVLDPRADHCQPSPERPGCVELTELDWVPITDLRDPKKRMVEPTRRACWQHCRCHLEYRNSQTKDVWE